MKLTEITKRPLQVGDYGLVVTLSSTDPKFNHLVFINLAKTTLRRFGGLGMTDRMVSSTSILLLEFPKIELVKQAQQFIRRQSRGVPRFNASFALYMWKAGHWVLYETN